MLIIFLQPCDRCCMIVVKTLSYLYCMMFDAGARMFPLSYLFL